MRTARSLWHLAAAPALGAGALCGGCISHNNSEPELSNGLRVGTFIPPAQHPAPPHDDTPTTARLDRSDWAATTFEVPPRDVSHLPIYRSRPVRLSSVSPYQRGDYPTHDDAGRALTPGSQLALAHEGLWAPLVAAGEVLLMIPRAVLMHPFTPVRGPTTPLDRTAPGRSHTGVLPAAAPPPAQPAAPTAEPPAPASQPPDTPRTGAGA